MANVRDARAVVLACLASAWFTVACGDHPFTGPDSGVKFRVTGIAPTAGLDVASTTAVISGQGFEAGDVVTIDGAVAPATVRNATLIDLAMPTHPAGAVDVTVTSPSRETSTLSQGFLYTHFDPLAVTGTVPATGAPDGFNTVRITGAGFSGGAIVLFDSVIAQVVPFGEPRSNTVINVWAPPHALGNVELLVKNPDGQTFQVPGGYTYAPSASFDFNGVWRGFTWETNQVISLTIENNMLVSVACGAVTHTFSPTPVVTDGRFSISGADGSMSGHLLSPNEATGTLAIAGCSSAFGWEAYK
jgi:hypothetical protein